MTMLMITLALMWAVCGVAVVLDLARRSTDIHLYGLILYGFAGVVLGPIAFIFTLMRLIDEGRITSPLIIRKKS